MPLDRVLADRIDDCVEWWHTDDTDESLHEYLGMDREEYEHWLTTGQLPPTIDVMDVGMFIYWPRAGWCWVCGDRAHYMDLDFNAAVCGGVCSWAAWEAMRLHDTPWRAW